MVSNKGYERPVVNTENYRKQIGKYWKLIVNAEI